MLSFFMLWYVIKKLHLWQFKTKHVWLKDKQVSTKYIKHYNRCSLSSCVLEWEEVKLQTHYKNKHFHKNNT